MISKEEAIELIRKDFVSVKGAFDVGFKSDHPSKTKSAIGNRTRRTGNISSADFGSVYSVPAIIKAGHDDDLSNYFYARVLDVFPPNNCVILFECDSYGTPLYKNGKACIFEGYLTAFIHLSERHEIY